MIRFKVIAVPPNIFFSLEIMRKSGKKTEFRINRMVPEKYEEINTLWQIPFENSSLKFRIHTPTFFFFFSSKLRHQNISATIASKHEEA